MQAGLVDKPIVKTLSASSATPEEIVRILDEQGAVIVTDMLPAEARQKLLDEMNPYFEVTQKGRDEFLGYNTERTGNLAARSAQCREMITNSFVTDAAQAYLGRWCQRIQLQASQIIRILPGEEAQMLHRDRLAWGAHLPDSIEPQFNTMWALTDFTEANGATVVAPGSQKWDKEREAEPHELTQAVMPAGSALFFTGTVIHGGGGNASDGERVGVLIDYCLGWLRQEENQYLCCPPDVASAFDPELQDLLGYTSNEALGYFSRPGPAAEPAGTLPPEAAVGREPRTPRKLV